MFYTSLGRLLMVDLGEDEEKFDAFMMPLTQSFESLGQVLLNQSSGYNSEEVISKLSLFTLQASFSW
jgi:exportin-7